MKKLSLLIVLAIGFFAISTGMSPQANAQPGTVPVQLQRGCTFVGLSWPSGTPIQVVADAITPQEALVAIWGLDTASGRWLGYSPHWEEMSDQIVLQARAEAIICVSQDAVLARPR